MVEYKESRLRRFILPCNTVHLIEPTERKRIALKSVEPDFIGKFEDGTAGITVNLVVIVQFAIVAIVIPSIVGRILRNWS